MPILDKEVWTNWSFSNREWLIEKGYEYPGKLKQPVLVKVSDLSLSSCVKLNCTCDVCGEPFKRSFGDSEKLYQGICLCKKHAFDEVNAKLTKNDMPKIKRLYFDEFKTTTEIAKIYNITKSVISKFMERHNLTRRNSSESHSTHRNFIDKERIIDLYINKEYSALAIENEMDISAYIIKEILKENNIKIRGKGDWQNTERWQKLNRAVYIEKDELEYLYVNQKINAVEIGKLFNTDDQNIYNLLHYYNIPVRNMSEVWQEDKIRTQKIIKVSREKYNADYYLASEEGRKRVEETNLKKYNAKNPFASEKIKQQIKKTNIAKYGTPYVTQNAEVLQKQRDTFYRLGLVSTSYPQQYLHNLLGGKLNYPISRTNVDILLDDSTVLEYDGGGHNLSVKMGDLTQEEFDRREMKRWYALRANGYKQIHIVSKYDYIPQDDILLSLIQYAKDFFKNTQRTWITFDIDNKIIKTSKHTISYDYGKLRKIKKSDLPIQSA